MPEISVHPALHLLQFALEQHSVRIVLRPDELAEPLYWSFHNLGDVTAFKKGPNQDRAFRHSF
jgi:hypothetical protein